MGLTMRTFTGEAVRCDSGQRLTAYVTIRGARVRAGVPVVHPGEVIHAVLGGLSEGKGGSEVSDIQH